MLLKMHIDLLCPKAQITHLTRTMQPLMRLRALGELDSKDRFRLLDVIDPEEHL